MDSLLDLLRNYRSLGVVVDSNLLLLFFLGSYDRRQVDTNSRLQAYSQQDFDLLVQVLNRFRLLITTPHILTEVSNLSSAISERDREAYFRAIASHLTLLDEQRVASQVCLNSRWARFGLTDAAIATIAKKKYLVITDDFRLSQSLQNDGIDALNFNHLRQAYWQMSN